MIRDIQIDGQDLDDDYSDDSLFSITSWGADLSFRELIEMYNEEELIKPELQRNYVWERKEASRFIESILMGLPIPSIFLAVQKSQKLIIDGYQRLMTVRDYVDGVFTKDNKVFKLVNTDVINERWRGKTFKELSTEDQRKIKSTTIHAILFEQKHPREGDTSMYQIFERINTGGRTLTPQEIRNCVYQGSFNKLLLRLNKNEIWRKLLGTPVSDSRMKDIELILRFFVMISDDIQKYTGNQISLKKELNVFMEKHVQDDSEMIANFEKKFVETITSINDTLGKNAFNNYTNGRYAKSLNPPIFDAVSVAYFNAIRDKKHISNVPDENHKKLLLNNEFQHAISERTTNMDSIKSRINLANKFLIEEDND
jgi:Protein of unknown function DUF262.